MIITESMYIDTSVTFAVGAAWHTFKTPLDIRYQEGTYVLLGSMSNALCPIQAFLQLPMHLFGGCTIHSPLSLTFTSATLFEVMRISCYTPSEADDEIATHTSEIRQFSAHSPHTLLIAWSKYVILEPGHRLFIRYIIIIININGSGDSPRVPKKQRSEKICNRCKDHGGAYTTHNTSDC